MYELRQWTWRLSEDKLNPLLLTLDLARKVDFVQNGPMQKINGRLSCYNNLVAN